MKKKQYSLITEKDIEEGIKNGSFRKEKIRLIRDKDGCIVKHLKNEVVEQSIIPSSLIQVHQNIIYQADLNPIITQIIETKNTELFDDLGEKYQVVLDSLEYYKNHKQRLNKLNSKALESSSVFDKRVEKYLNAFNSKDLSNLEDNRLFDMLDSYLNILLIYMISTFWLHKDQLSKDTVVIGKLKKVESQVKKIYQSLLLEDTEPLSMAESVYAYLFLEGGKEIHKISRFVEHDNRCNSPLDFFESYSECCIKKEHYSSSFSIKGTYNKKVIQSKLEFVEKFFDILEKIKYLKDIFEELVEAGSINFEEVQGSNNQTKEKLEKVVVLLALHNND